MNQKEVTEGTVFTIQIDGKRIDLRIETLFWNVELLKGSALISIVDVPRGSTVEIE